MKDVLIRKSDQGEISVFDERDDFIASFRDGEWTNKLLFRSYDLEEFTIVQDDNEVIQILEQARTTLNCPLNNNSSDSKAKSA